jgi:glycosyltransferase involved in cell wall biosynthesis
MPSVSVVIPTYNRADVVADAINSVLGQSHANVEVVVVDDGSCDDTEKVVRAFGDRVTYFYQRNEGVSAARNLGALCSSGEYLMFLDSDDVILPGAIDKLSAALDANPDSGVAYCGWQVTDGPGSVTHTSRLDRPSGSIFYDVATDYLTIVHCGMVRRKCIAKARLFDTALDHYEDIDFWMRMAANWPFVFVPETLVEYRQWRPGASRDVEGAARAKSIMMEKLKLYQGFGWIDETWMLKVRARVFSEDLRTPAEKRLAGAHEAYTSGDWSRASLGAFKAIAAHPAWLIRRSIWRLALRSAWNWCVHKPAGVEKPK